MKPFAIFAGCMRLFVVAPIWYYLMFSILIAIHPDRLVWFLFWIYVPAGLLAISIDVIAEIAAKKDREAKSKGPS